jgi:hypothetical protein
MLVETHIVASGLKILTPVGTTISAAAADVQYARVSLSVPTVNTTCTHTTNTSNSIASMAKIIFKFPNASFSLFHRR